MSINKMEVKNFTVFNDLNIEPSKGINIFIGENGTGKTHLLKSCYALINLCAKDVYSGIVGKEDENGNMVYSFASYFKMSGRFSDLINKKQKTSNANINLLNYKQDWLKFIIEPDASSKIDFFKNIRETYAKTSFTYIPAKDMLTHSKGFISLYDKFDLPFDKTYYDIISKSLLPNLKEIPQIGKNILPKLEKIIGGTVVVENDTFYIKKEDGTKIDFSVEAEGIKKIALLWQLIMNESITENSILFWDEPEANINPKLIHAIAEILLELSRQGVQIFVATHNYIFAKYVEVLKNDTDDVLFHALYKTETDGVKCETEEKFSLLENNSILKENIVLYEKEIDKAML